MSLHQSLHHSLHRLGSKFASTAKLAALFAAILFIAGCTALARVEWDREHGRSTPVDRVLAGPVAGWHEPEYYRDVKPVFDRRCVVCHGCYDAPCQLKLTSFSGVDRGASQQKVYDGSRLIAENLTRLFIDGHSTDEWRRKDFYPVLNETGQNPANNLAGSSLFQMLQLKREHPLPSAGPLRAEDFDFSLDRAQTCSRIETFSDYARANPQAGMPFGMPAIEDAYFQTIKRWLETGAKVATPPRLPADLVGQVQRWEQFLNGDSLQERLMSRYLFEHLYLGDLYFGGSQTGARFEAAAPQFFKLVRSRTPPGYPTEPIATRRPFDDPGVERVYYRLEPMYSTTLVKTHMPYALDGARMEKWRAWFLANGRDVHELPSYAPEIASNPFKAFRDIPAGARYRFLLDEAQYTIMGFIKGPVCRGQIALNVIDDQFWVVFIDPDTMDLSHEGEFLEQQSDNLRMPAEAESNAVPINWRRYSQSQRRFVEAKTAFLAGVLEERHGPQLDDIWNGYGVNRNAALTVFRHFDSATVVQGLVGDTPKTAWVVGYSLLERIHYLLVAGYDVYGNVGHQLMTRMYMDFLRMEGEFNFLAFLPQADRMRERRLWYRNVNEDVADFVYGPQVRLEAETEIPYRTHDPKTEFFAQLREYLGPALSERWTLSLPPRTAPATRAALDELQHLHGLPLRQLPELSVLTIAIDGQKRPFTLVHNVGRSNVSTLLFESDTLLPAEDTVTLVPGILGAYPSAFFALDETQLPQFVAAIGRLTGATDYRLLVDRFGVRRNSPFFWAHSDWLHEQLRNQAPLEAGILDYNRLENR